MTVRPLRSDEVAPAPLRVVRGRRWRRPQVGMWVTYTAVAVFAFFALIYSRTALDENVFIIGELDEQIAVELDLQERYVLEVARLKSPNEIVPAAESLGLVLPEDVIPVAADGVLVQRDDGSSASVAGAEIPASASP